MIEWRTKWYNEEVNEEMKKLNDYKNYLTDPKEQQKCLWSFLFLIPVSSSKFHLWTSLHPIFNLILHSLIQQMLMEHLQWWNQTWCYPLRRDQWIREVPLLRSSYLKSSFDKWTRNYITLQMPMRLCKVLGSLRMLPIIMETGFNKSEGGQKRWGRWTLWPLQRQDAFPSDQTQFI